jgi:hypothetical protein
MLNNLINKLPLTKTMIKIIYLKYKNTNYSKLKTIKKSSKWINKSNLYKIKFTHMKTNSKINKIKSPTTSTQNKIYKEKLYNIKKNLTMLKIMSIQSQAKKIKMIKLFNFSTDKLMILNSNNKKLTKNSNLMKKFKMIFAIN